MFYRFRLDVYPRGGDFAIGNIDDAVLHDGLYEPQPPGHRSAPIGNRLYVRGWALEPADYGYRIPGGVLIGIGDRVVFAPTTHVARPDIAENLGDSDLVMSGFSGYYPLDEFDPGRQRLTIHVVAHDFSTVYLVDRYRHIDVVPSRFTFPDIPKLTPDAMTTSVEMFGGIHETQPLRRRRISRGQTLALRGSSVERNLPRAAGGVFAVVDGDVYVRGVHGLGTGRDPQTIERSGFSVYVPTAKLEPGDHEIAIAALTNDGNAYAATEPQRFTVLRRL